MKIKSNETNEEIVKEENEEKDNLPADDKQDGDQNISQKENEDAKKIELENAELKGKVAAFETIAKNSQKPAVNGISQEEAWKNTALSDINSLDDDAFTEKYKHSKMQVNTAILQYDFQRQTSSQKQQIAELRAENRMTSKYSDFSDYREAIDEAINDIAPEVKQDPDRLAKAMERAYLAAVKSNPQKKKEERGDGVDRRSIASNSSFEKPKQKVERKDQDNDEIPSEFAPICKAFGISSEKERQKYINSDEIETSFGDGWVLRDSKKGFEKVA